MQCNWRPYWRARCVTNERVVRRPSFNLLLLFGVLIVLITMIQVGLVGIVFEKMGLSRTGAYVLLFGSLLGSGINVPLFRIRAERGPNMDAPAARDLLGREIPFTGFTRIAVNLGGCLIPVTFCIYLLINSPMPTPRVLLAVALVSAACYWSSRPLPGVGIGIPFLVAPLSAAVAAVVLAPDQSAPLAYVGGTLGVLIGADLLRLGDVRKLGAPMASIGGAGTFDGIFITGIVAVLLA